MPGLIKNQKDLLGEAGVIHFLPLIIAAVGLIAFLLITNTTDFKNKLFSNLFQKPSSQAVSAPIIADYKRVFISSDTTNGNFAGISSGDVVCGYLAQNAKLGGQWMAWLSDSKT
ncbi:hypothetical protein HYW46_00345, partial [Candidatus Daviesbacteria bacterium]|nr:hypothetical protein [Candidatus Daviesbacteria bacterium]